MNRISLILAIALVFGLLATPVVNAEEVSSEDLIIGGPGNGKELVMPGDNVSITPKNKFEAPGKKFLKAKKAFDIDTAKEAIPEDYNSPRSNR